MNQYGDFKSKTLCSGGSAKRIVVSNKLVLSPGALCACAKSLWSVEDVPCFCSSDSIVLDGVPFRRVIWGEVAPFVSDMMRRKKYDLRPKGL